jgi:2-C-methyl-D-erythritol 2,4-cyclodiphosphate synthase
MYKMFQEMRMKIKSGIGFDAHRFARGRRLVIGGVEIDYDLGLEGHSDADVLIHAIVDAIAGPALGRDIGNLFPDTDMAYKGIDSKLLLGKAVEMIRAAGFEISNVDAEIIAQKPKMAAHIPLMRGVLAGVMGMPEEDITIKATTTEKMGFTGREEGIAALATAIVIKE